MQIENIIAEIKNILEIIGGSITEERTVSMKPEIWGKIDASRLRDFFLLVCERIGTPHLTTIIGEDLGDRIHIMYPLDFYDESQGDKCLYFILSVEIPKEEPKLKSISDILRVAWIYEVEVSEILGVQFEGLKKEGRYYIPDTIPEGIIMRKDKQDIVEKYLNRAPHPLEGGEND